MPSDLNASSISLSMKLDKKAVAGELKFILPEKIGSVRIHSGITEQMIKDVLYA
jgi:3-dehydroquinate synthetase